MAPLQGFQSEFPPQQSRELFWRNKEFWRESKEFYRPELRSSSNEIFDAMSTVTAKADTAARSRTRVKFLDQYQCVHPSKVQYIFVHPTKLRLGGTSRDTGGACG